MAGVLEDPSTSAFRELYQCIAGRDCWRVIVPILKLPMLWGVLAGLLLNFFQMPLHYGPIKVMHLLAQCFPPLLYILLGSVLRFRLGLWEYLTVLRSLACRTALYLVIGVAIWFSPLDSFVRGVAVLCLSCPCSTTLLIYGAEFNYDAPRCAMTYNFSALLSALMIHLWSIVLITPKAA